MLNYVELWSFVFREIFYGNTPYDTSLVWEMTDYLNKKQSQYENVQERLEYLKGQFKESGLSAQEWVNNYLNQHGRNNVIDHKAMASGEK